jgi:hypothetical protein
MRVLYDPPIGTVLLASTHITLITHTQTEGKLVLKRAEETKTAAAMHGLSRCVAFRVFCIGARQAAHTAAASVHASPCTLHDR